MLTRSFGFSILFCLAISFPAAAQYAAGQNGDIVQLEDTKNQTVIALIPSAGNITSEMKVKGVNVLRWPYTSVEDFKARGVPTD